MHPKIKRSLLAQQNKEENKKLVDIRANSPDCVRIRPKAVKKILKAIPTGVNAFQVAGELAEALRFYISQYSEGGDARAECHEFIDWVCDQEDALDGF